MNQYSKQTFKSGSYGYRPKRSGKEASIAIREDLYNKAYRVVEIAFEAYFDSIPHGNLLKLISQKISDGAILKLVKQSLKVDIDKVGNRVKVGVPQGSPISPLYSNIYLNLIDKIWCKRKYHGRCIVLLMM